MLSYICCLKKRKQDERVQNNKLKQRDVNGELIFEDIQNLREFIKSQPQN
jgi:hypothetical protein